MKISDIVTERAESNPGMLDKVKEQSSFCEYSREFLECLFMYTHCRNINDYYEDTQQRIIRAFDKELQQPWSILSGEILWRGMSFREWKDEDAAFDFREHDVVENANYLSTSENPGIIGDYWYDGPNSASFKIHTKEGGKAIWVQNYNDDFEEMRYEDIDNAEAMEQEAIAAGQKFEYDFYLQQQYWDRDEYVVPEFGDQEVIIAPGSQFNVVSKEFDEETNHWNVELQQIK